MDQIIEQSHDVASGEHSLHVKRLFVNNKGAPVLMLHGSMEDGRIFYSRSMKGLAPYLARQGYDVFVVDMSARGQSRPPLSRHTADSQTSAILKEIPTFKAFVDKLKGNREQHWVAHSWGGVLMLAYVARFGGDGIASMSFFGTKRRISVVHPERIFKVDIVWNIIGKILGRVYGYFPSKHLKIGSDNEPKLYHRQVVDWIYKKKWIDLVDGFDYNAAFKKAVIPPTLYLAGKNDTFLGHPKDVKKLMLEVGGTQDQFVLLSKATGHLHDYDHINMLTHPDASKDQFPLIVEWMREWGARG